jgi:crossover junction endodeoxyribonuclease RuvC
MTIYIGFDPGLHGGVAVIYPGGAAEAYPMLVSGGEIDARAIAVEIGSIEDNNQGPVVAIVEKVGAMPKQGVSSTFKFGKGYGTILGVLGALGIRTELVTPQAWKKVILAGMGHEKADAIAWCRRAYPAVDLVPPGCRVPHDGMAESLAIADYGRRMFP